MRIITTSEGRSALKVHAHSPICCSTRGSIILAICWLSFDICEGFTFFDMSPPLNSPLIPPIFFTICANFVYCLSRSSTSRCDTPAPRATRCTRPGCLEKMRAPSALSSSWSFILSMMVMRRLRRDFDSCSFPFVMKSLPRPGIMLWTMWTIIMQHVFEFVNVTVYLSMHITYHDLPKRSHFHDILELLVHVSQSELTWKYMYMYM